MPAWGYIETILTTTDKQNFLVLWRCRYINGVGGEYTTYPFKYILTLLSHAYHSPPRLIPTEIKTKVYCLMTRLPVAWEYRSHYLRCYCGDSEGSVSRVSAA